MLGPHKPVLDKCICVSLQSIHTQLIPVLSLQSYISSLGENWLGLDLKVQIDLWLSEWFQA